MSGILIYTPEQAKRNTFAISKFRQYLGVEVKDENYRGGADYVINRTNDYKIAEYFEKRGVRVFNPSAVSRLANDKQRCYEFMQSNGIRIMPVNYAEVPAVKKSIDGHGGTQVFMIERAEEFEQGFVYQKPCDTPGRDVRVWTIGGEIIASVLRKNDNDFRSNYCLGGTAEMYTLSSEQRRLAEKIAGLVGGDYIGIDFLFHGGEFVFNEIEDSVGARTLYAESDIDILKLYCDYIKSQVRHGGEK